MNLRELLQRAANGDDIDDLMKEASCNERIQRAEAELDDACAEAAEDMTGQDGEERCNRAARDLIDARDSKLRQMDPEGYAERRAMGEFRN